MKLWLDTEFNQYGGETISIGITADNGAEFYEAIAMTEAPKPWIVANVLPILNTQPLPRIEVQSRLVEWLGTFDESFDVIVDHPADAIRFLQLLEADEQGGIYETNAIRIEIVSGLPGSQKQYSAVEHNALSDARGLRDRCREKQQEEAEWAL